MVTLTRNNKVTIFHNAQDLFQFAAEDFMHRALTAIADKGVFSVVLSGGNTPKLFFDTLAGIKFYKNNIPWQQIQFFFGDERYVPANDVESNYHMAYEHLFSKVPIHPENIHRILTEFKDPKEAAADYEKALRKVFFIKDDAFPSFDLLYLGLGDDAHTASLMPFSDVVTYYTKNSSPHAHNKLVASIFTTELSHRITLTPTAINHAKNIIFLVVGKNKAAAAQKVLEGQINPQHYPAQLIRCVDNQTIWYLDKEAAKKLKGDSR
jgi:6-phosphogluconolactonase